jgi:hypothetical protein
VAVAVLAQCLAVAAVLVMVVVVVQVLLAVQELLTLAVALAEGKHLVAEQVVQALFAFATQMPLTLQHQQQGRLPYQHQAVTEFTNGQEAGA